LRIGTSIKLRQVPGAFGGLLSRRRDQPLEAELKLMLNLLEDFLEIF
jgi:hypothetical protein